MFPYLSQVPFIALYSALRYYFKIVRQHKPNLTMDYQFKRTANR